MDIPSDVMGIYLTDICNYKCIFCSVDNPSKKGESIILEDIFKILDMNKTNNYEGVALWGGEPTVRKDFFEILEKIKSYNFSRVIIETNGSNLSDTEFLKRTLDNGVNYFIISIHGASSEVQDSISLMDGSFDKIIKTIKNLKKNNMPVRTNTVVNKLNYHQLPEIVEMLIELDVDHINISALRNIGTAARNMKMVTPTFTEVDEYVAEAFEKVLGAKKGLTFDVFPFCRIKGYENYQLKWSNYKMFYGDKVVDDFSEFTNKLKTKGKVCRKCNYIEECGGVFRGYIDLYGWDEFGY